MIIYYLIVFILIITSVIIILTNHHIIFKNSRIGFIIRSKTFKYIIKRLLFSLFTLFLVITAVFFLIRIMPKEYFYTHLELNDNNHNVLLDDNIFKQLLDFYYNILPFPKKVCTSSHLEDGVMTCSTYEYKIINLGYSITYIKNVSVWSIIKEKCGTSFFIGSISYILQCLIGYSLGVFIARKENKFLDKAINYSYLALTSLPSVIYFYAILLFFMSFSNLPVSFDIDNPLTYIVPLFSITLSSSLVIAYWVKKYLLIEADSDYVKFAMSKGLDEKTIFYKHILRNALTPLIRTIPTSLVLCFSGFYLLEATFNIPGAGYTLVNAINLQDVYLVQGLIIFFSFLSILAYFIGDLITFFLDKRVNLGKERDYERE